MYFHTSFARIWDSYCFFSEFVAENTRICRRVFSSVDVKHTVFTTSELFHDSVGFGRMARSICTPTQKKPFYATHTIRVTESGVGWVGMLRNVRKPITARNHEGEVNGLLWCYVCQWWLRTSYPNVSERRQRLYAH